MGQRGPIALNRELIWTSLTDIGLEHLRLSKNDNEIHADGSILGVHNDAAFRVRYQIKCDENWRARSVVIESNNAEQKTINLTSDGLGNWFNESRQTISEFENCLDVDISATPFTNTLPICRLSLRPDESAEIKVIYFAIPEMETNVEYQQYTCLELSGAGSRYKFESLDGGFTAIISTDKDGLVKDYPGLFRRAWINHPAGMFS